MGETSPMTHNGKVRFGPFEFDPTMGELRKHGIRVKLQTKPLAMLSALVEKPGEVVPREQLRLRLWPAEPYVDFEAGLNTAAKRLRDALSDSADEPRYVETIPRTGYRFIAVLDKQHAPAPAVTAAPAAPRSRIVPILGAALTGAIALIVWLAMRQPSPPPEFRQVSFRKGQVVSARFAPDGQTVLYTLQNGAGRRVYASSLFGPESREIAGAEGSIVSVSKSGEMALIRASGLSPLGGGTLWRMPVNGGGAIEVDRNIFSADWAPDGSQLAVARATGGTVQLEYPPGKVLYKTSGYLTSVRFRPDGREIAFVHHPLRHDEAGSIEIVDLEGHARVLSKNWTVVGALSWHRPSGELWFSAARQGELRSVWAITASGGAVRRVLPGAGNLSVSDVSPDGRALVGRGGSRLEMAAASVESPEARDISWLDWSSVKDVSRGGESVLFEENGDGVAGKSVVFLHQRADQSTLKLGNGMAMALNSDASEALVLDDSDRKVLRMIPIGPGKPRELPRSGLTFQWARFYPDGKSMVALASRGQEPLRLYKVGVADGQSVPIAPPGMVRNTAVSPDGSTVAALCADGKLRLYPAGEVVPAEEPLAPILWTRNGIIVQHTSAYTSVPARLSVIDPKSGRTRPFAMVDPGDRFGVNAITRVVMAPDARHWAFSYRRTNGELFLSDRLR